MRSLKAATVFSGALMIGLFLGLTSPVSHAYADGILGVTEQVAQPMKQGPEPPLDPNKKKPGEDCESKDECQKHHSCAKVGDKKVCKAPPRQQLPPGAVT